MSAHDVLADIADFEEFLDALVALEDPGRSHTVPIPHVHYIRQLVFECLEPLCTHPPQIFDTHRGVFYGAAEHAYWARRTGALLRAFFACQTLHMCEQDLRRFCATRPLTHEELLNTRLFIRLANTYGAQFRTP